MKKAKAKTRKAKAGARKAVKQRVSLRIPTVVALRLQRTAEIAQQPQEVVVLSLLSLALALVEAQAEQYEVV